MERYEPYEERLENLQILYNGGLLDLKILEVSASCKPEWALFIGDTYQEIISYLPTWFEGLGVTEWQTKESSLTIGDLLSKEVLVDDVSQLVEVLEDYLHSTESCLPACLSAIED